MTTTRVLKVDPRSPEAEPIQAAAEVLRAGGLVAFPTETVYGLGANALDAEAVRGIFRAKERPAYDPLIVHLAEAKDLERVARDLPPVAFELAARFWPGPLTLVLPRGPRVPSAVTAGGDTVAVRVPSHPVARALIRAAGVPVAAPSANRFGRLSPTRARDVLADLEGRIDLLLDAGPTTVGVESTILSLLTPVPTVLRPGGVEREALEALLGEVEVRAESVEPAAETVPSPGTLAQHYAPRADLVLYRGARLPMLAALREDALQLQKAGRRVGLLLATEDLIFFVGLPLVRHAAGSQKDLETVARRLYKTLRALDEEGVETILARDFGSAGLGLAIRDRLTRAAGGYVVEVTKL